jgi:hypothetical protein
MAGKYRSAAGLKYFHKSSINILPKGNFLVLKLHVRSSAHNNVNLNGL